MPFQDLLKAELEKLDNSGLRRQLRQLENPQEPELVVDGKKAINFSSNNYLGLATDQALRDAAISAIHQAGAGAASARLLAGNLDLHRSLELRIAAFHKTPAALLFNSGYHANIGVIAALAGPDDVIFSDAFNHASIIDGCRLSRSRVVVYPHCDTNHLNQLLQQTKAARTFIVSESVFSMDGDRAPLVEIRKLADRHGAVFILDEAHAIGALGPTGRGLAAASGVRPDVLIATLGKALGSFGAYVCGPQVLIDYLVNRSRSFVFTTALPPAVAATASAALDVSDSPRGNELRARLSDHIQRFGQGLRDLGLLARGSGQTQIFPVLVGDSRKAMDACARLLELGIFSQGIRPPTVPPGTARLRFSLLASHADDQIQSALDALATLTREGLLGAHHE